MTTKKVNILTCPLCTRPMVNRDTTVDAHHLIPKSEGGRHTSPELCHIICHRKIHSTLSESELAKNYDTWDKLKEHEEIIKFIKWVKKKHPEYMDTHKDTKSRSKKRRRR